MARGARLIGSVLVSLVTITGLVACSESGDKPISEQSCAELAATAGRLGSTTSTTAIDFDAQREMLENGAAIARRVTELGGCPDQPGLHG